MVSVCWFTVKRTECVWQSLSKIDDFAVDTLFYFDPVQRIEYRRDMFSFGVPVTERAGEFCSNYYYFIIIITRIFNVHNRH